MLANWLRKLYHIIGDIIDKVYQKNIESDTNISNSDLLLCILPIERRLSAWKSTLPPNLQVKSKEDLLQAGESKVDSSLNAVITLRYLNSRILLHRPILSRFLDQNIRKPDYTADGGFLHQFAKGNVEVCIVSACEMIDIIYSLYQARHHMLTSWWFAIYYSKWRKIVTLHNVFGTIADWVKLSVRHLLCSVG